MVITATQADLRTESQLQKDVIAELAWDPAINAALISVEVRAGVVTLSGHVDRHFTGHVANWSERELATHSAWGSPGVRHVVDRMTLIG